LRVPAGIDGGVAAMGRIGPRKNRHSPRTLDATLRSATIFQSAGQVAGLAAGSIRPMADRTPHFFRSGQSAGQAPELAAAGIIAIRFMDPRQQISEVTDSDFVGTTMDFGGDGGV